MFELKESDLPELERLAKIGYPWIARDASGFLYGYKRKPVKKTATHEWYDMTFFIIGNEREEARFVQWSDPEPLNIAAAIAQIKAQTETAQTHATPPTWNERINLMTVEEKAEHMSRWLGCYGCPFDMDCGGDCKMALQNYLNSPCEGGEKG